MSNLILGLLNSISKRNFACQPIIWIAKKFETLVDFLTKFSIRSRKSFIIMLLVFWLMIYSRGKKILQKISSIGMQRNIWYNLLLLPILLLAIFVIIAVVIVVIVVLNIVIVIIGAHTFYILCCSTDCEETS